MISLFTGSAYSAEPWFHRVLITNDDGIDRPQIQALADLVISGVISGANLADEDPSMMKAVPRWCVELASTEAAAHLQPGQYLAVNFPDGPADQVKGFTWASLGHQVFFDAYEPGQVDSLGRQTWDVRWWFSDENPQETGSDVARQRDGWITVSPMRLDDLDRFRLERHLPLPELE